MKHPYTMLSLLTQIRKPRNNKPRVSFWEIFWRIEILISFLRSPSKSCLDFYIPIGFTKCSSPSSLSGLSGSFSETASINKYSSSLRTPVSQKRDNSSPKRNSITKTTLITASQKYWSVETALTKDSSPTRLSPDLEACKNHKRNEFKFQPQNRLSLLQKSRQEISSPSIERPNSMTGRNLSPTSVRFFRLNMVLKYFIDDGSLEKWESQSIETCSEPNSLQRGGLICKKQWEQ